ncbi:hypothetical protein L3Q82_001511 [Scortum barcoo]|uniref:Uncharacterized protein n=1 Tax=Scortum barcoo TaxID=214431 RepID=A0ACB8W7P9_9TELE|nr:hypothetical protein L3Q82_001511 [Scortum barcoo]
MNTEAVLKQKRLCTTKRHFAYEMPDEPQADAMRRLEVSFFDPVVDCSIRTLEDRFQSLGEVRSHFGVLHNFGQLDAQTRRDQCKLLGDKLTFGEQADIDGSALATEMESLPELPKAQMTQFEMLTYLSQSEICELYPNLWVALRIACTLIVTSVSAEQIFSKHKLLKNYLSVRIIEDPKWTEAQEQKTNKRKDADKCCKISDIFTIFSDQMGTTESTEDLFRTLQDWCLRNNLQINAGKTKELVVDFRRRSHSPPAPVSIQGTDIDTVKSYKYLGVHLNDSLDWSDNTRCPCQEGQQQTVPAQEAEVFWSAGTTPQDLL